MTPGEHDLHTLAGAFVLDALSDSERSRFATHLADCAECRSETRELQEAAARLGTATAVQPRPEVREKTIRATRRISQDAPALAPALAEDAARTPPRRPEVSALARLARSRLALAAVVVLVAGSLGLIAVLRGTASSPRQDQNIALVLQAPDAVLLTARISTGGMATAVEILAVSSTASGACSTRAMF